MEKLSKKEIINLEERQQFLAGGPAHSTTTIMVAYIDALEKGEGYKIEKNEWKLKGKPEHVLRKTLARRSPLKKFSTKSLKDRSGWIIQRIL